LRVRALVFVLIVFLLCGCKGAEPTIDLAVRPPELTIKTAPHTQTVSHPTITPPKSSPEWILWNESTHKNAAQSVNCETCHGMSNEPIESGESLCADCHLASGTAGEQAAPHQVLNCLDCHNAHSTTVSCSNSGCHADIRNTSDLPPATPIGVHVDVGATECGGPGCHVSATQAAQAPASIHGPAHASVACIACHAPGQAKIGRSEINGEWGIVAVEPEVDAALAYSMLSHQVELSTITSKMAFSRALAYSMLSHQVELQVDCARCHYEGNPWELQLVSEQELVK